MNRLKQKWEELQSRPKKKMTRSRVVCFVLAFVVVMGLWLAFTKRGEIARYAFLRSLEQDPRAERVVRVYSGDAKVAEYFGRYLVEVYSGKVVVYNQDTHEVVEVYGNDYTVVDSSHVTEEPQEQD